MQSVDLRCKFLLDDKLCSTNMKLVALMMHRSITLVV